MLRKEMIALMFDHLDGRVKKGDLNLALDSFIAVSREQLEKGKPVTLTGFGTFSIGNRKARPGRNPKTGESCHIPERKVISFKASKIISDLVN
jgi:nucleoid DNA-binding protein